MQFIQALVNNPVKVAVGVLLVALFGAIALARMPMQLTPEVEIPKISISTRWPGASPEEVEREIVLEQEEQLQSVEGVTKMSAECQDSSGSIVLEFSVGTDLSEALLKVNSRLQQVREYPEDADEPVISTSDPRANAIAWFILRPRTPSTEEVRTFQQEHPELAERLEPIARAHNVGLRTRRLAELVKDDAALAEQIAELLPPEIDVPKLRRFAEDFIEARFERVPGVSASNIFGGREEEMQVVFDPQRLAARNVTILDVRRALRAQNRDISAGDIWDGKRRYVIRTLGRFRSEEQLAEVIVAQGDADETVYLRDVARVQSGYKKPTAVVKNFGTVAMAINCNRETGANVLDVMHGLRAACASLNDDLLARRGLELIQVYDETDYIYSSIRLVNQNIVFGGILTIVVLLVFLRSGRSTIVIALAIPTSIIGTFLMLKLMGRSLNVISLAGLAFAVGMLVDNAVVVLENCYRHAQLGENPMQAAVRGAQEVWGAVVASTLTTLAVFLPVLFVEEEAGQLFRDIALSISSAVGLSLVVSITVIPTTAARLLRTRDDASDAPQLGQPQGRLGRAVAVVLAPLDRLAGRFVQAVVGLNRYLLQSLWLRLATVAVLVLLAAGLSYLLMPPVEYLPAGNRNLAISILLPPPGYNIDKSLELGVELEQATKPFWDVDPDAPRSADDPDVPAIEDYFFVAATRRVFFGFRAVDDRRMPQLVDFVRQRAVGLPGTMAMIFQRSLFSQELGAGRSIDIEITGPELERLVELGQQVLGQVPTAVRMTRDIRLSEVDDAVHQVVARDEQAGTATIVVASATGFPRPSLDLNSPELHVVRKLEQAADMGVSTDELGYSVDALIDGAYATDYYIGGDKIDLTIVGNEEFAEYVQDVRGLPVATPSGELARLEGLADIALAGGPEQINRRERERAITIQVQPPPEIPLETAIEQINGHIVRPMIEQGDIGQEYRISLAGTADKLLATWQALRWNFLLALLVTYLLMAALFESWLYPLVIILSVPLGAVGGIIGLQVLNVYLQGLAVTGIAPLAQHQTLDVLTMLGFIILIGTVVNNPILIVHQSLNHMRHDAMSPSEAIVASVRNRIRPIFMTTSTTLFGLSPLVLFSGAGSELYRGLGAVVLGGLLVSTVFTLILVPTLFSLMMDAKASLAARWNRA